MIKGVFTDFIGRKFNIESITVLERGQRIYLKRHYYIVVSLPVKTTDGIYKVALTKADNGQPYHQTDAMLFVPVEEILTHGYIITECKTKERR